MQRKKQFTKENGKWIFQCSEELSSLTKICWLRKIAQKNVYNKELANILKTREILKYVADDEIGHVRFGVRERRTSIDIKD